MVRIFITDFSALHDVPPSPNVKQRTRASYAAYRSLELLYQLCFHESIPQIERTPEGKPYLAENPHGVYFSISHTEDYAIAVLTDEGECGVDIETERDPVRIAHVERRFLSGIELNMPAFSSRPQILFDRLASPLGGTNLCELTVGEPRGELDRVIYPEGEGALTELEISNELSAVSRWTLLEAVLKADGRGFGAYKSAEEIAAECAARHFVLTGGDKRLFISVAIK